MTDDFDDFSGAIVSRPAFRFKIGEPCRAASMFGHGCGTHMESGENFRGEPFIRQAVSKNIPTFTMAVGWRFWWEAGHGWAIDHPIASFHPFQITSDTTC